MSDPLGGLEPARGPEPQRIERRPRPFAPTTCALLVLIGIGFAAEWIVGGDPAVESEVALVRLGALYLPAVRDGDWWRIGAYAFLHIGWAHVAMNAWSLWILGPQLEATYGSNLTMGFFSGAAIAGGAASALWATLRGHAVLAAGASGGLFGLFGVTAALAFRVRHRIPPEARRSIYRRIAFNLVINAAIAVSFPVDSAAHIGGLLFGTMLGLIAPLPSFPPRAWHRPAQWLIVGFALVLACMEGAAVAWAAKPRTRTLRGPGIEANVPGLLIPQEPGVARVPGAEIHVRREAKPLRIEPGESAVRIGDRTWLRQQMKEEPDVDVTLLAAADGSGRVVVEFGCWAEFCKGAKGARIYEQVARTVRTVP